MSNYIDDKIKLVLFDLDDTLFSSREPKWAQHKHVARTYHSKELTDEHIRLHWGKPLKEMVSALYETQDIDQAMANNYAHDEDFPKVLFPHTIMLLEQLHASGKIVGIVSATTRLGLERDLNRHNFPYHLISYTQTADESIYHKPDPRVFDPVLQLFKSRNITTQEMVYIGDALYDMDAAVGAGLEFIGVETGLVSHDQFRAHGATSVTSIADLCDE